MKKLLIVLFVTLISLMSYSQTPETNNNYSSPDFELIQKEVNNYRSDLYYPKLLKRFETADTTLTIDQMRYFYYGTATRTYYDPYKRNDYSEIIKTIKKDSVSIKEWKRAARNVDNQLKEDPTDIKLHIYKHIVYENLYGKDSKKAKEAHFQLMMLLSAVKSTGDGLSVETAYYVICPIDEYGIMELLGLFPTEQYYFDNKGQSYDGFGLADNIYGIKSMFFNITICKELFLKKFGFR